MFERKNSIKINSRVKAKLKKLNSFSMSGIKVLENLYHIATDVAKRKIAGDVVECGVYNGGSAGAIACGLINEKKHYWLYDSFEGMPDTIDIDGSDAKKYVGKCIGNLAKVDEAIQEAGINKEDITIRKGWFEKTLQLQLPTNIAVLHVDCDWYESVILCLNTFYDLIQDGGIIIIDDFGHWEGCREAVYDFFAARKLKPLIERFGHSQIFWVKNRTDNRIFSVKKNNDFSNLFHR